MDLSKELQASIYSVKFSHQDQSLLLGFLINFSSTEQENLLVLAQADEYFWVKLLVRLNMLKSELAHGSTDIIEKELVDALATVRQIDHLVTV